MSNLNLVVADIVQRLPDLANDCVVNSEQVLLRLLAPSFEQAAEIEQAAKIRSLFEVEGEFDESEPACMACGDPMGLNEGCEWSDDNRLNICDGCAQEKLQQIFKLVFKSHGLQ